MALQVNLVEVMETKFMDRKLRWNIYRLYYWTLRVPMYVSAGLCSRQELLTYKVRVLDPCPMPYDRSAAIPKQFYVTKPSAAIETNSQFTHSRVYVLVEQYICIKCMYNCIGGIGSLCIFICVYESSYRLNCLFLFFF